ncbi:unnamed protein product [Thelazia callipaeda]|uniref:NARG2_C domain-containing protein n=1 Tax=Thelazia callipaeda TaxID=103827 RepID=A0A0N5DBZ9_THECL|nr:unnamed protein product [Thelazia callipaeda]
MNLQTFSNLNLKSDPTSEADLQKSIANLYYGRKRLAALMGEKKKWLNAQRRASLLIQPCKIDELNVMSKFPSLLHTVATAQLSEEQRQDQLNLIEQIIQESIIIEWPKVLHDKCHSNENHLLGVELDFAPLIHRARNVVKCRTSHPTMRVRVCAIAEPSSDQVYPKVMEALFRATLVKLSNDAGERQIAGRLILTQREGTSATKYHDQSGVAVNMNGKLLVNQARPECSTNILLEQFGETAKKTDFKYEHGTLCAIFPELGVTLNSMIDRRQLSTRYAIQVDVALNIENKLIVKHMVLSHEFLIAITNDQTESLLNFIYWPRLLDSEYFQDQPTEIGNHSMNGRKPNVPWGILKEALQYFVKTQCSSARPLDREELLHVQCMLFYPKLKKASKQECEQLEQHFFGNIRKTDDSEKSILIRLKHRLLTEMVSDDVLVTKHELMLNKCISLADGTTELRHNLWQWLYRATEIIIDVGHKFCPAMSNADKKCAKTKRPNFSMNECQSALSLYNNRVLTLRSAQSVIEVFKTIDENDKKCDTSTKAIFLRFCDENVGHVSFAFSNIHIVNVTVLCRNNDGKPLMGSLSCEQIKDFKQGIAEVLMDETFPKHYDRIVQFQIDQYSGDNSNEKLIIATPLQSIYMYDYADIYHILAYVQMLLHASSVCEAFSGISMTDLNINNVNSQREISELILEGYNNVENGRQATTNRRKRSTLFLESKGNMKSDKSENDFSMSILRGGQSEMQRLEDNELEALDLTKKRVKQSNN